MGNKFYFLMFFVFASFMLFSPVIVQPQEYYVFADNNMAFGLPHFGDFLSNISFLLVAIYMVFSFPSSAVALKEKYSQSTLILPIIMLGSFMVGFGSSIFHLNPTETSLILDRFPMTIVFTVVFFDLLFSLKVIEHKNPLRVIMLAIFAAIMSLLYWKISIMLGVEDLRPYVFVQFFPMLSLLFLTVFFYKKHDLRLIFLMFVLYVLAKIFEFYDAAIFELFGTYLSGHNIKHVLSGLALIPYWHWQISNHSIVGRGELC